MIVKVLNKKINVYDNFKEMFIIIIMKKVIF